MPAHHLKCKNRGCRDRRLATDGLVDLLRTTGLHDFSMAALSRWCKVSRAAVAQRGTRSETLRMIVNRLAWRYVRWSARPAGWIVEPRLPATDEERHGVWAWALLAELARGDEERTALLHAAREAARSDVEAWWDSRNYGGNFEEYFAVLTGLRLAMALGLTGLSVEEGRELLAVVAAPRHERPGPPQRPRSLP